MADENAKLLLKISQLAGEHRQPCDENFPNIFSQGKSTDTRIKNPEKGKQHTLLTQHPTRHLQLEAIHTLGVLREVDPAIGAIEAVTHMRAVAIVDTEDMHQLYTETEH